MKCRRIDLAPGAPYPYCASPLACNGFGYCRERNFAKGVPDEATQAEWRKLDNPS